MDIEIEALRAGREAIGEAFVLAVDLIREIVGQGGRAIVMGMGKSGHVGHKIAATFASTGTPSFFVHPAEAGHGDLGMITSADIVIAISQSGKSDELLRLIPYFKRNGIKIIAMTGDSLSPLAEHSDVTIDTAVPKEACPHGLAPTASTTLTLALGDALAICLLQAAHFSATDFAQTHPHGALGRRLLVGVQDVMVPKGAAPTTKADLIIKDALLVMSRGGMGFLIVTDRDGAPIGVFTDGDLRRCLDRDVDIKRTSIAEVMNADFVTIRVDELAVAAVDVMEKSKVSALPVIHNDGSLAGAINMRQLLQAGVV
ncbi:KpsF/GutQ family sugar-phosphate isomerase [Rhizobium sp. 1399]|uniref:KpsF/GutQ family sugar-phosphate isomerase n=1 Tax=Rhizobium sp. 1399 TaxID=2817758 RepID=UPI002862F76B|nr:KpsF/GutQ family sugar-phosphate isomerase [Rhizobium sp. 1399]MDR6671382.1 arabinose-5-phosphate isomerase [Rhizobium sp. 1399]